MKGKPVATATKRLVPAGTLRSKDTPNFAHSKGSGPKLVLIATSWFTKGLCSSLFVFKQEKEQFF